MNVVNLTASSSLENKLSGESDKATSKTEKEIKKKRSFFS